jgi:hypothetical protein
MNTEKVFKAVFWTLLVSMSLMRFWFGIRVWRTGERILADRAAHQREGLWAHVVEYVFFLLLAAVVLDFWFQGGNLQRFAFPRAALVALGRLWFGDNQRGTICVDPHDPGTILVPLLAASPWPPVDC